MYYRKAYINLRHHPKFIGFYERLAITPAEAYGHLGMWWDYVGTVTGTLGVLSEAELVISFGRYGADWPGDPEPFRLALLGFEFLHLADDGRYSVANWSRYCTAQDEETAAYLAKKRVADAERKRKERLAAKADRLAGGGLVRQNPIENPYGPDDRFRLRKKRRPKGYDLKGYFAEKGVEIPANLAPKIEELERHNMSRDSHNEPDMSRDSHNMSQNVTKPVTDASCDTPPGHNDRPRTEFDYKNININHINGLSQHQSMDDPERDASCDVHAKSRVEESREEKDTENGPSPFSFPSGPPLSLPSLEEKTTEANSEKDAAKKTAAAAQNLGLLFMQKLEKTTGKKMGDSKRGGRLIGRFKSALRTRGEGTLTTCIDRWFETKVVWVKNDVKYHEDGFFRKLHELEDGELREYENKGGQAHDGGLDKPKDIATVDDFGD